MSLFPGYAPNGEEPKAEDEHMNKVVSWNIYEEKIEGVGILSEEEAAKLAGEAALLAEEAALLASSSESCEEEPPARPAPSSGTQAPRDFYWDGKPDSANLGVSTLYYPGRPMQRSTQFVGTAGCCLRRGSPTRQQPSVRLPTQCATAGCCHRKEVHRNGSSPQ